MVQCRCIVSIKGEKEIICALLMTLSDPSHDKSPHFYIYGRPAEFDRPY